MDIVAAITAVAKFLGIIGEDVGKAQDAAHDKAERQAGADAQNTASLEAAAKTSQAQVAAVVNAAKTEDAVIDKLEQGKF